MWGIERDIDLYDLDDEVLTLAAVDVANELLRRAEGRPELPATWRKVADGCSVRVEEFFAPGKGRGEYVTDRERDPGGDGPVVGMISVNTAFTPYEQARTWVHELAHYLLHVWCPPRLERALDVYRYCDEPTNVRHQVACLVEEFIFAAA